MNTSWSCNLLKSRIYLLGVLHFAIFSLSYLAAILLRFDCAVPTEEWNLWLMSLPWCLAVKIWIFYCLGSFQGWWRYVTFSDLVDLMKASILSAVCIAAINHFAGEGYQVPRGIIVLDLVGTILLFGTLRASVRMIREHFWPMVSATNSRPAFVVGANRIGEAIVRQINHNARSGHRIVGFLDKDPASHGSWFAGVPVLGFPSDAVRLADRSKCREILVGTGSVSGEEIRTLVESTRDAGISVKIVPRIEDILNGQCRFQLRDVEINDLLQRDPITLDSRGIEGLLQGRCVMVTGAGGSIGAEICRQILKFAPDSLILVERSENSLFWIDRDLRSASSPSVCHPCIADILDRSRMEELFARYRPAVVFHAAAHKHVPMMELCPGEAVKNNVFGTKCVADLSHEYGVEHFVLISTDKAVNPTNVMGVSKRLAERYVCALNNKSATRFSSVRFGNVLGSAGSVVPIFKEQIRKGGPVTITHPEMQRFFMTIPEATQLVLQAASMGKGGELFVLDMGEQVRIADLAHDLIRLSGLSSDSISIEYTGIRPGEKLYEELYGDGEELLPTSHAKVNMAYNRPFDNGDAFGFIKELDSAIGSRVVLLEKLRELVPEFSHLETGTRSGDAISHQDASREAAGEYHESDV